MIIFFSHCLIQPLGNSLDHLPCFSLKKTLFAALIFSHWANICFCWRNLEGRKTHLLPKAGIKLLALQLNPESTIIPAKIFSNLVQHTITKLDCLVVRLC
jgi:hypothetical protein